DVQPRRRKVGGPPPLECAPVQENQAKLAGDGIQAEAIRLAKAVLDTGVQARLMGGMAVWLQCPSARRPPYERLYADLDFVASSRNRRAVADFFERAGYIPERMFNAIHGHDRLNFAHSSGRWTVDVVFDEL